MTRKKIKYVQYPNTMAVRLTDDDLVQLHKMSEKLDIPPSTLLRRILRKWMTKQEELLLNESYDSLQNTLF